MKQLSFESPRFRKVIASRTTNSGSDWAGASWALAKKDASHLAWGSKMIEN